MNEEKFNYNVFDGFLEDGKSIGIWEVLLYLNNLYEENFHLKEMLSEVYEENEFLNSYLEELEDSMFSEKDFSEYLQAFHQGDVKNIKRR